MAAGSPCGRLSSTRIVRGVESGPTSTHLFCLVQIASILLMILDGTPSRDQSSQTTRGEALSNAEQ
eukprot:5431154-Pyramimonas_sp.AAC.1